MSRRFQRSIHIGVVAACILTIQAGNFADDAFSAISRRIRKIRQYFSVRTNPTYFCLAEPMEASIGCHIGLVWRNSRIVATTPNRLFHKKVHWSHPNVDVRYALGEGQLCNQPQHRWIDRDDKRVVLPASFSKKLRPVKRRNKSSDYE